MFHVEHNRCHDQHHLRPLDKALMALQFEEFAFGCPLGVAPSSSLHRAPAGHCLVFVDKTAASEMRTPHQSVKVNRSI